MIQSYIMAGVAQKVTYKIRNELTEKFEQLCNTQLTDKCISHPQAQALKEKIENEKAMNTTVLIYISFALVLLIVVIAISK